MKKEDKVDIIYKIDELCAFNTQNEGTGSMMPHEDTSRKGKSELNKIMKISAAVILCIGVALLTVYFFPQIASLKNEDVRESVRSYVQEAGAFGILLMLGIQLIQVILSIIPGEPVEVLFGFIYGPVPGAVLCLFGMALGSFVVFCVTRALGKNYIKKAEQNEKYNRLKILKDPKRRDALIFLLFFLPGTPKDTLTYFAPFSGIELWKFLLISTLGRIPSVITSTFAGESIFAGNYIGTVVIFAVTGVIGIVGILIYNSILKHNEDKNRK